MPGLPPLTRGALHPHRRAPAVDFGAALIAIVTVAAAVALYALTWWVLGTSEDDGEVFGSLRRGRVVAGAGRGTPLSASRA